MGPYNILSTLLVMSTQIVRVNRDQRGNIHSCPWMPGLCDKNTLNTFIAYKLQSNISVGATFFSNLKATS